jgi:hypothetical protein
MVAAGESTGIPFSGSFSLRMLVLHSSVIQSDPPVRLCVGDSPLALDPREAVRLFQKHQSCKLARTHFRVAGAMQHVNEHVGLAEVRLQTSALSGVVSVGNGYRSWTPVCIRNGKRR